MGYMAEDGIFHLIFNDFEFTAEKCAILFDHLKS